MVTDAWHSEPTWVHDTCTRRHWIWFYKISHSPITYGSSNQNDTRSKNTCCLEKIINAECFRSINREIELCGLAACVGTWLARPRGCVHADWSLDKLSGVDNWRDESTQRLWKQPINCGCVTRTNFIGWKSFCVNPPRQRRRQFLHLGAFYWRWERKETS